MSKHRRPTRIQRLGTFASNSPLHLTVAVSQVFSRTDDLIRILRDPEAFAAAIREELPGHA